MVRRAQRGVDGVHQCGSADAQWCALHGPFLSPRKRQQPSPGDEGKQGDKANRVQGAWQPRSQAGCGCSPTIVGGGLCLHV